MTIICSDAKLWPWLKAVVGSAHQALADVDEALRWAERLQPMVVLLDVRAGGNTLRAVETVPRFLRSAPGVAVILISRSPSPAEVAEADALGAYSVVDRNSPSFLSALRRTIAVARTVAQLRQARPALRRLQEG